MTVEWVTPPSIIAAIGPFDLDPCAAIAQPWPTAARSFTRLDNGLTKRWGGRVFLNPPYRNGIIGSWLARMAEHDRGTALIFARTDTAAFHRHVLERAAGVLFMEGRVDFHVGEAFTHPKTGKRYEIGDLAEGNAGAPTVLCAYGFDDLDVLAACAIAGRLVPLRFPRAVLGFAIGDHVGDANDMITWRAVIAEFFAGREGPVELDDLYRHFAGHQKAAANPNYAAKIRQQLQRGPYRRVDRGLWETAP